MSAFPENDGTTQASFTTTTGTTAFPINTWDGSAATPDYTFAGTATIDYVNSEAFNTEWRKLRSEFLKILLRDDSYPIKHFSMRREMDPKTKETTVHLQISFLPSKEPKKGPRRTV